MPVHGRISSHLADLATAHSAARRVPVARCPRAQGLIHDDDGADRLSRHRLANPEQRPNDGGRGLPEQHRGVEGQQLVREPWPPSRDVSHENTTRIDLYRTGEELLGRDDVEREQTIFLKDDGQRRRPINPCVPLELCTRGPLASVDEQDATHERLPA